MADFDLTQTDAQVQSILNDAQDAQGAGAQTTLTTDYIMLKDTSGNYHKILKDSFTEACRNVLAGLLVNNDKGTTISQIPAIASGDFGSVTPANLASVLGGQYTHTWRDGVFVRYLWDYQSVGGNPIKMNGIGACIVVGHHVNNFAAAYIIYQPDNTAYTRVGYHEIFKEGETSEFNMYLDSTNRCFYFKGNGGGISIGMIPLCGDLSLQQVSADLSQMIKIF